MSPHLVAPEPGLNCIFGPPNHVWIALLGTLQWPFGPGQPPPPARQGSPLPLPGKVVPSPCPARQPPPHARQATHGLGPGGGPRPWRPFPRVPPRVTLHPPAVNECLSAAGERHWTRFWQDTYIGELESALSRAVLGDQKMTPRSVPRTPWGT